MIIDHICKMVRWVAVILQNHLIVDYRVVEHDLAVDNIFENRFALGNAHSNDVGFTLCLLFSDLVCVESCGTESIILSFRVLLTADLNSHLLKALSRAETRVSISVF